MDGGPAAVVGLVDIGSRGKQPLYFLYVALECRNVKRDFGVDLLFGRIVIRVVPLVLEKDM